MMEYEKDYNLLRPLDLDAAKRGDAICYATGADATYIFGPNRIDSIVVQWPDDRFGITIISNLRMKPLFWVEGKPVYKGDVLWHNVGKCSVSVDDHGAREGLFVCKGLTYDFKFTTWEKPKVKREGWVNIYPRISSGSNQSRSVQSIYGTKCEADNNALGDRIACVRIEWEE